MYYSIEESLKHKKGLTTQTFPGRNSGVISYSLDLMDKKREIAVLVLGSGIYEPWECREMMNDKGLLGSLTVMDGEELVTKTNREILSKGFADIMEIGDIVGRPLSGYTTTTDLYSNKRVNISTLRFDEYRFCVASQTRKNVDVKDACDILEYLKKEPDKKYDLIFVGSVINNIYFQRSGGVDKVEKVFVEISRVLKEEGFYSFTTNEFIWHDELKSHKYRLREMITDNDFSLLFKCPMYCRLWDNKGQMTVTENCSIVLAKHMGQPSLLYDELNDILKDILNTFSRYRKRMLIQELDINVFTTSRTTDLIYNTIVMQVSSNSVLFYYIDDHYLNILGDIAEKTGGCYFI